MTENLGSKAAFVIFLTLGALLFALDPADRPLFLQDKLNKYKVHYGLDLRGGAEIRLQIPEREAKKRKLPMHVAVAESVEVIEKRIYDSGIVKDSEIRRQGSDRILIQLPGVTEAEMNELRAILTELGSLEFRIVADDSQRDAEEKRKKEQGPKYLPPAGYAWYPVKDKARGQFDSKKEALILLPTEADDDWTGDKLDKVGIDYSDLQQVATFSIKSDLKSLFGDFTGANIKNRMAIVYNGEIVSAPTIQSRIEGNGIITGLSPDELNRLQKVLKSGSLKVKPIEIGSNFVGPSLGQYTIKNGQRAIVLGFTLVIAFMLLYYLGAGVVACVALVLNLLFLYAALVIFGATLTLPGIAGIILTVGMAVDANIIIFERIREERAAGKTLVQSVETGYARAFTAIVDANVTTLITAVILYVFGTGAVKGFAVTLLLGIILSMFTALYVTKMLFGIGIRIGIFKQLKMLNLVGTPKLPFVRVRRGAMVCSFLVVIGGLVMFSRAGDEILGIDMQGGALTEMALAKNLEAATVRSRIPAAFRAEVQEIKKHGDGEAGETGPKRRSLKKYAIRARNLNLGYFTSNRKKLLQTVESYLLRTQGQPWVTAKRQDFLIGTSTRRRGKSINFGELYRFLVQLNKADEIGLLDSKAAANPLLNHVPLRASQSTPSGDAKKAEKNGKDQKDDQKAAARPAQSRLDRRLRESLGEVNEEKVSPDYLRFVLQTKFEKDLIPEGLGTRTDLTGGQKGFKIQLSLDRPYRSRDVRNAMKATGFNSYTVKPSVKPESDKDEAYDYTLTVFTTSNKPRRDLNWLAKVQDKEETSTPLLLSEPFPTSESIGKLVAKHQKRSAFYAGLFSLIAIMIYITIRFQWIYGVAAVITLTHDVLIVLGAIAVFGMTNLVAVEINLPVLAAFLTIIGYSLNDTIVVFDRIRENFNKPGRHDFDPTIDLSINQTLSRTLLTSLTTLLAVTILFALNYKKGGVIEGFAFAMIVGVMIGTYSSVFIATPILVEHHHASKAKEEAEKEARRQKKKQKGQKK